MSLPRRILVGLTIAAMILWSLAVYGVVSISDAAESGLWALWILLLIAQAILERRERLKDWQAPEPSPASSAAGVILATGGAAVAATLGFTDTPGRVPVALAIVGVTATLAIIAFRFARKHAGEIGEAQFETPPARDA